jgi:hypothetical protein
MKAYHYNPILTVVNGGQFYSVEYSVWDKGVQMSEFASFRNYKDAKSFFNTIPLK